MHWLPLPGLGDRRNDFSGFAPAIAVVVPRDLAHHQSEERRERPESSAIIGVGELRHGMDLDA